MIYSNCSLYGIKSKKMLVRQLHIVDKRYLKQSFVDSHIHPYVENKNGKKRLIEPPDDELKRIQKRLKNILGQIEVPFYVFSGVKKKSYVDNARLHSGKRYVYKLDLTAFFPSTSRERAYTFFRDKLKTSPDVAECLANLVTVDIDLANCEDMQSVNDFLNEKGVITRNHLISGAPTSQLLSYLINVDMFDRLYQIAEKHSMAVTVYVDDITFSSCLIITGRIRGDILRVIHRFGFRESKKKVRLYSKSYPKLVTGTTISSKGVCVIRNSMSNHIMIELLKLKKDPNNKEARLRLQGLISAARQVDSNAFPAIRRYAYNEK